MKKRALSLWSVEQAADEFVQNWHDQLLFMLPEEYRNPTNIKLLVFKEEYSTVNKYLKEFEAAFVFDPPQNREKSI